jgi:cob(I)alamin adenosyltransferase
MSTGLVHIYTGEGKGKTTASVGLAVRARSRGLKVLFAQFMKEAEGGGEVELLEKLGVEFVSYDKVLSTVFNPNADREEIRKEALTALEAVRARLEEFDLAILDEFLYVVDEGLITEGEALALIKEKPAKVELVLTGRGATNALIDAADHVTEMKDVKHPFTEGVGARRGIDY